MVSNIFLFQAILNRRDIEFCAMVGYSLCFPGNYI